MEKMYNFSKFTSTLQNSSAKAPFDGITSKMLQEICQKYYYPGLAKYVKKRVEGCDTCANDKKAPNNAITPELLNLPEWDLGLEDAMQFHLLPNLPTCADTTQ